MEKPMNITDRLASSLGRRDEIPNQELAQEILEKKDKKSIAILVENLSHKNKNIQSDCIKVLYEIGEKRPDMISGFLPDFMKLLNSKNNRLQWGGMAALAGICAVNPEDIFARLSEILEAAEKGSVITRDHAVSILIKLAALPKYQKDAFPLLFDQMLNCPTNQLPMYAERAAPIILEKYKKDFLETLKSRLGDIEKESKRKRVEKVIGNFSNK